MAIQPTAADPFGLGTDIALLGDLNPVWGLVSGFTNLGYALARRLNAVLGSLFSDLGYGFDLNDLVNQSLLPSDIGRISQAISGQCLLDERVQTCRAALSLDNRTSTLSIAISGTIPSGQAFTFILSANGLTVALITVNGTPVAQKQPVTVVAGPSTVIIQNGSSTPGLPGPPGPAGGASESVPIADVESVLGSEDPQAQTQKEINWGALPASITITLNGMFSSAAGTATFRVRINGSDNADDGTVVLTLTASSASATPASASATISNPGGLGRLIVTAASSGAGVDCAARNLTLTVR
jgi:hypothetical protein